MKPQSSSQLSSVATLAPPSRALLAGFLDASASMVVSLSKSIRIPKAVGAPV